MFPKETKVLVVDDMMTMRKIVKKCLGDLELKNVTEADDGTTAWKALEEAAAGGAPFQLVVSDWNMPKMKGLDLLKKIRENTATKSIPFIFVTAESEMSQVEEGLKAGANSYILKPFTPENFTEKIASVYKRLAK